MKKLTLNQAWRLCLKMWKWIVKQIRAGSRLSVEELKQKWLETHTKDELSNNCYFCEYDEMGSKGSVGGCRNCPGKLVERRFHCNTNKSYSWRLKPLKFYAKLLELDKKRKAK